MVNKGVIEFIKNNLNHDFEHDFNYLMKELVHYQSLRGGDEIVKEIKNLIKTELGEEGEKRLVEISKKGFDSRINLYKQALDLIKENKKQEASNILVKLIDTFPVKKKDEDVVPIYNFQNMLESLLCYQEFGAIPSIRQVNEPITGYFFHLAVILFTDKDYEESNKMLDQALAYNPVYVEGLLLRAECHLNLGNTHIFLHNVRLALKLSYRKIHFAKCYFLLSRYYLDLEDKEIATALAIVSRHHEKTPFIDSLIAQINALSKEQVRFTSPKDLTDVFQKANIQFGPSKMVMQTLNGAFNEAKAKNNKALMKYYLTIIAEITNDPKAKKDLEELKEIS
ncbi:MAG: hypothetical protein IJX78_04625 [Bacilli bacterium]|nr:hypothetical protein [Bacilli bacterium]